MNEMKKNEKEKKLKCLKNIRNGKAFDICSKSQFVNRAFAFFTLSLDEIMNNKSKCSAVNFFSSVRSLLCNAQILSKGSWITTRIKVKKCGTLAFKMKNWKTEKPIEMKSFAFGKKEIFSVKKRKRKTTRRTRMLSKPNKIMDSTEKSNHRKRKKVRKWKEKRSCSNIENDMNMMKYSC